VKKAIVLPQHLTQHP
jgi:hypothetical protein